ISVAERVRRGIAPVLEARRLFPRMTVYENLEMGAYIRSRGPEFDEDLERVFTLFPRVKERLRQLAGTLSGGEQQMVAIGRALMARPKLLCMDEPSMGLAPVFVVQAHPAGGDRLCLPPIDHFTGVLSNSARLQFFALIPSPHEGDSRGGFSKRGGCESPWQTGGGLPWLLRLGFERITTPRDCASW